nr:uncharacterized protein LOC109183384 [Ipomoea batatas]
MNTLGSPLEALAFNYLSYGFLTAVNNVWTWVAVLTAAVSFWRIKTLSLSVHSTPPRAKFPNGPSNLPAQPARAIILPPSAPAQRLPAEPPSTPAKAAAATSFSAWERESLTKGKFTAYFDGGDESDGNVGRIENIYNREGGGNDDKSNGDGDGDVLALGYEWYERWERVMQTKTGDAGWYGCQDLTAINGNVVRLWSGGCRRRSATALVAVGPVNVSTW